MERQYGAAFTLEPKEAWSTLYATVQTEMMRAGTQQAGAADG